MKQILIIPGRLPGYNQLNGKCWAGRYRIKKSEMEKVMWCAKAAGVWPVTDRVRITIRCYEQNGRRDADNVISGANKIVLDALQKLRIIQGDGQKHVEPGYSTVTVDRKNPRVEVEIEEV